MGCTTTVSYTNLIGIFSIPASRLFIMKLQDGMFRLLKQSSQEQYTDQQKTPEEIWYIKQAYQWEEKLAAIRIKASPCMDCATGRGSVSG